MSKLSAAISNKLTESTFVPLGAALVVLTAVVTVVMWVATVASATTYNSENLKSLESRIEKIEEKQILQNEIMIKDLSRIKDRLGIEN